MPIYEYKCEACKKTFELIYSKSGNYENIKCACGGKANKIISGCNHKIYGYCHKNAYRKNAEAENNTCLDI